MELPTSIFVLLAMAIITILACFIVTIFDGNRKMKPKEKEVAYLIHLMGTNFKNPDGVLMQEVIGMMSEGDDIRLQLGDFEGNKSVRVDSHYGTIGFLPRRYAYIVSDIIKSGTLGEVKIERIFASRAGRSKGVVIKVCVDEKTRIDPSIF